MAWINVVRSKNRTNPSFIENPYYNKFFLGRVMVVDVFQSMDLSLMMKTLLPNTLALVFCRWYVFVCAFCTVMITMFINSLNSFVTGSTI